MGNGDGFDGTCTLVKFFPENETNFPLSRHTWQSRRRRRRLVLHLLLLQRSLRRQSSNPPASPCGFC